jgi:phytanoyl-CoA hydroxylase
MTSSSIQSDPSVVDLHDPRLYERRAVVTAIRGGFDAITDAHIEQFGELGFLSIDDAFTPEEVGAGIDGLLHLIAGGNPEFKGIQFEAAARDLLPTLTIEQRQDAVRKLMWFVEFDARLKALSHHPKLLATVSRLLGPESAPQMFQDMALLKPPKLGREKPWHQDKAYFNIDVREPVVGVWVALDEATPENGCMHLLPDIGRAPRLHYMRRDWQICDTEILGTPCIAAPLKPGGVLLFDGLLVHGTPHNGSGQRRRAVQFHYQGNRFPKIENDARMSIYGGEGRNVEC